MRSLLVCLFLACLTGAAFAAAPPAKVPAAWLKLIDQLGDDDDDAPNEAEKTLTDLGEDVLAALRAAGRTHKDVDVRLRALVIAAAITKKMHAVVTVMEGHTESVLVLAVSPDGKRVASGATGSRDGDHAIRV